MGNETTRPNFFRCDCGKLLRRSDLLRGKCVGHKVKYATTGDLFDWLKIKWWTLTGAE